jgi:hypothetical protein
MRPLLALLFLVSSIACGPDGGGGGGSAAEALKKIDEKVLQAHVAFLASDELEGRAAGFPGNEKAVAYLVQQVEKLGLQPAGDGSGFTQEFTFRGDRKAKNVIAVLEGSDPKLKAEFVGIGCHLDHVGRKGQEVGGQSPGGPAGDEIWNGADDNASGTSAVLAVARAFSEGKVRPKRSVLFCWWNAEEAGLLGSRHWVKNATRPLDRVTYYLNLDMVGRNPERPMDMEGVKNAEGETLERIISAALQAEQLKFTPFDHSNEAMFRSDGASFLQQGIPASMMFTSWHADYHKAGDHAEKIAYPNLARIARAAFRIVNETGNLDRALRLNPDTPLGGKPLRIRGEDVAGKGAFKVISVGEGSPLAKAGLQAGDVVTGLAGQPLPAARPLAEFWRRVQGAKFDEPLEIEVERDGGRTSLKATWPRKPS